MTPIPCVECLPILYCLVEEYENWMCYGLLGGTSIDLNCICSGPAGQPSVIAKGLWMLVIVHSLYFSIKMANENVNIFKYKNLSESHLFLKIFWILSRKYILIPVWLPCWNFVLFSTFSVSIHSVCCNHCLLWAIRLLHLRVHKPLLPKRGQAVFCIINKWEMYLLQEMSR